MRVIEADEIGSTISLFERAYETGHDEAYRLFRDYELRQPADLPEDPFSAEYAARYLDLYRTISGRDAYAPMNERATIDIAEGARRPFPYSAKSTSLAGQHYILIGQLLGMLDIKQPASVLEFGFGWGNTTLALAMLGYDVTGIDIETSFCDIVTERAKRLSVDNIAVVNGEFLSIETWTKRFDAAIFFESFHHCWDFARLLRSLRQIIKPGGKLYFGSEPIDRDFPVPWGIRLDGQSLYAAHRMGWMELGFRNDFFSELLSRTGWIGQCVHPHFWIASRKDEPIIIAATDPRFESQALMTAVDGELDIRIVGGEERFALYGPYLGLPAGRYRADLQIRTSHPATMEICHKRGEVIVACRKFTEANPALEFALRSATDDVEVRVRAKPGFSARLSQFKITALG
jgi:SAM-dependent methyltransferase